MAVAIGGGTGNPRASNAARCSGSRSSDEPEPVANEYVRATQRRIPPPIKANVAGVASCSLGVVPITSPMLRTCLAAVREKGTGPSIERSHFTGPSPSYEEEELLVSDERALCERDIFLGGWRGGNARIHWKEEEQIGVGG